MFESLQNAPLLMAALYSFIAAMTPGPNNLMLLSSGLTFGYRRTLPHMLGVAFGFLILTTAIVIGVGAAIMAAPSVRWFLLIGGTLFMLYLIYRTVTASADLSQRESKRPLRFWEAAAFQGINPKAWGFGLPYMALVTGAAPNGQLSLWIAIGAIIIPLINTLLSAVTWVGLGQMMARLIQSPKTVRGINIVLGLTLFLMIPLMWWSELAALL